MRTDPTVLEKAHFFILLSTPDVTIAFEAFRKNKLKIFPLWASETRELIRFSLRFQILSTPLFDALIKKQNFVLIVKPMAETSSLYDSDSRSSEIFNLVSVIKNGVNVNNGAAHITLTTIILPSHNPTPIISGTTEEDKQVIPVLNVKSSESHLPVAMLSKINLPFFVPMRTLFICEDW
eukprot:gnl/MRDRNA2_/MRDRNA2_86768_c0_seq1.p2 gnl/MRDRNA2_/MRDRNA2_86768_c0~~gnl/MRDRNA2_/MRDRNA2_86768_c0_seq1.p2  ORF type:complete len:179 (-),score=0.90 gnl/MRDRNA2_/MRDRNA2_86768_c0_seq1:435-971(-)